MGRGPTVAYHKEMIEGYVTGTLTCLSAAYLKKRVSADFPLVLNIEPTNACNLNCYLCPRTKAPRKVGYMDFSLYERIISECAAHKKLKMINFHKDGEPLIHPRIFEMIRFAARKDVAEVLHLNTNGLFLDEPSSREFLGSGIDDVTVSVDASRRETFKKIKGADLLEKVEENVERLFRLKRELRLERPFIRVKIMEYEDTRGPEIKEFISRWKGIADDVQVTGVHNWSGAIDGLKVTDEVREKRYPCVLLWYMLAVNWDGRVSACNVDWDLSAAVGDLKEKTLGEIWNGTQIKRLRKAELAGRHDSAGVCRDCVVWAGGEDMTDWLGQKKEFYT